MSLIYGYNYEKDDDNSEDVSDLEKLVGEKTDNSGDNTAFGKIQKNKEDISSSIISTANVIASVVSSLGQKTDAKIVDTAFGRIKKNKKAIIASNSFVGSSSSVEGESTLKGTQLLHASTIAAHSSNLLELEDIVGRKDSSVGMLVPTVKLTRGLLGTKTDSKTVDTAFGRIKSNEENTVKRFNTAITFTKFGDRKTVKVFNSGGYSIGYSYGFS